MDSSPDTTVHGNHVSGNTAGIKLVVSPGSNVSGNEATGNGNGITVVESSNTTVASNVASASDSRGIQVKYSDGCTVLANVVLDNLAGIDVQDSGNVTVASNVVSGSEFEGIHVYHSPGCMVSGNNVSRNFAGILATTSSNTTILENNSTLNDEGIAATDGVNYSVQGNIVMGNRLGIRFSLVDQSRVSGNIALDNREDDVVLDGSNANNITGNVLSLASAGRSDDNAWDDGALGNYWVGYETWYPSATSNGVVWDIPHAIHDDGGQDNFPLAQPLGLNMPPSIQSPAGISYSFGGTGNNITWIVSDFTMNASAWYEVYRDGTLDVSGPWESGIGIVVVVDGLPVGTHNYTIIVDDGFGGTAQGTVIVTVLNVAPVLSEPADVSHVRGTMGNTISWTVTDASVGTPAYTLLVNGVVNATGSWESGVPITVTIDDLPVGTFNYTIIVDDGLGGSARHTVLVSVTAPPGPLGDIPGFDAAIISIVAGVAVLALASRRKPRRP